MEGRGNGVQEILPNLQLILEVFLLFVFKTSGETCLISYFYYLSTTQQCEKIGGQCMTEMSSSKVNVYS